MKTTKGYTLLFAVIVSMLVLSIGTFILSVSRKEAILASSARDSIYALYSADSGIECAIEHLDVLASSTNSIVTGATISCGTQTSIPVTPTGPNYDLLSRTTQGTSTFSLYTGPGEFKPGQQSQSGMSSCASTSVSYVTTDASYDASGAVTTATSTVITVFTRGYNIGYQAAGNCDASSPRKVERALQYTKF